MSKIDQPNIEELPDYIKWYKKSQTELITYATIKLTADLAVAVVKLFFPDFVLYKGAILLKHRFDRKIVEEWYQHFNGNIRELEVMLNTVEVAYHVFDGPLEDQPYENIEFIGLHLVKSWRLQLHEQFPDRKFKIVGQKHDEFDDYVISFWQVK
jgi:hypothetical protein